MENEQKPASSLKTWWVAVRPFAYTGSVLPVVLGAALAWHAGFPLRWGCFVLTLLGVVCFHTAANLLNDCFDYRRGLDTTVNPGSGAIVRGWLSDRQVHRAALLFLGLGTACGAALIWLVGWTVLLLGVLGAILVLGYTRSGFCLKYAGLGDFAIFVAFGILPVLGAYWVQTQTFAWQPIFWSLPMVSFTVGILHANNWRDIGSDSGRQCRTLASILGEQASRSYYRLLMLGPFVAVVAYLLLARFSPVPVGAPAWVLLVFLALPLAIRLARRDWRQRPGEFAMLDARTAQLHLVFGVLLTAAFVIARLM